MRKSILFFILLLLTASVSYAESEIPDPAKVAKLNVRIVQSGTINAEYDALDWLRLNITAAQDTPFQRAATQQNLVETEYGDKVIQFAEDNPALPYHYEALTLATVQATHVYSLPDAYSIPASALPFLEPTEGIQSDDPRIKAIAQDVTKDAITNFEKIALLAIWVNDYMTYDLDVVGNENKDAIWALENKVGVCAEYTSLFIALARSIGIPARYVSAWAYGPNGWEAHAYAEVYIGEWVPVDPLWLEAGNLDATHIKFSVNKDNRAANDVLLFGRNIRNLRFENDQTEIKILNFEETETLDDYELLKSADELGPGQEGLILLKFKGKEYQLMELSLEPCIGDLDNDGERDTIVEVKNKKRVLILEPGKDAFVYWQFATSNDLQENALYTCPLALNSRLLKTRTIDVKINTANLEQDDVTIEGSVTSEILSVGNQQTVTVNVAREGRGRETVTIGTIGGGLDQTAELLPNQQETTFTFSFPVNHPGMSEVAIYTSSGDLLILPYEVTDEGEVLIEQVTMPEYLAVNDPYQASIKLRNKRPGSQLLTVSISVDGKTDQQQVALETTKIISIPLSFATPGEHLVTFQLAGNDISSKQTHTVHVFEPPVVTLRKSYFDPNEGTSAIIFSSEKSTAKSFALDVDGKTYTLASIDGTGTIHADIEPGAYVGTVSYKDLAGKEYNATVDLFIKKQSIFMRLWQKFLFLLKVG